MPEINYALKEWLRSTYGTQIAAAIALDTHQPTLSAAIRGMPLPPRVQEQLRARGYEGPLPARRPAHERRTLELLNELGFPDAELLDIPYFAHDNRKFILRRGYSKDAIIQRNGWVVELVGAIKME